MARFRVPTQAFRNFLSILLGFVLGAVNNLIILPWAFADDLGEWGLVRIVMAWGRGLPYLLNSMASNGGAATGWTNYLWHLVTTIKSQCRTITY